MNLNYLHECQRTEYARISKSYIIKKSHLSTETQKDCYLLPLRRDDDYMMGIGGVVDRNYHYLDSSSVRSGHSCTQSPSKRRNVLPSMVFLPCGVLSATMFC